MRRPPVAGLEDVLPQIDSLQIVYCQSWPYDDPVGRLAAALGASPRHRLYSGIGGTTPQDLVNRTAEAMQRGRAGPGADLQRRGAGHRAGGQEARGAVAVESPQVVAVPVGAAAPVRDSPTRCCRRGRRFRCGTPHAGPGSVRRWRDDATEAATMMAAMSGVAATNPHAWRPTALDAATVGTATADNRYVGWPYTKHEVAVMDVDMSAALLVATAEKADALGVTEERRLYLSGWAYAEDPASIAERADMSRSVAMSVAGRHALAAAGVGLDEIDAFDLYSCFPSSLRLAVTHWDSRSTIRAASRSPAACRMRAVRPAAYMMHAIASAFDWLGAQSRPRAADRRRHAHGQTRCRRVVVDAGKRRRFTARTWMRCRRKWTPSSRAATLLTSWSGPGDGVRLHRCPWPRRGRRAGSGGAGHRGRPGAGPGPRRRSARRGRVDANSSGGP